MRHLFMGVVVASFSLLGCGPDIRGQCEAEVACEGGNDLDIDACVALQELTEDFADEIGCGEEYTDYLVCVEPFMKCVTEPTGGSCTTDAECGSGGNCVGGTCERSFYRRSDDAQDACEAESNAIDRCE